MEREWVSQKTDLNISVLNKSIQKFFPLHTLCKFNTICHKGELAAGVPQGGILFPLLKNWRLDGLEETVKVAADIRDEKGRYPVDTQAIDHFEKINEQRINTGAPSLFK